MKYNHIFIVALVVILALAACQSSQEPLPTLNVLATFTPSDTPTEIVEQAALPSSTPLPPTDLPTLTPIALQPSATQTPEPSATMTFSVTASATQTDTPVPTTTQTFTPTPSLTPTSTMTPLPRMVPSDTSTQTLPTATEFIEIATEMPTEIALVGDAPNLTARITAQALNIRNGPGDQFDVVAHLDQGAVVPVLGTDQAREWILVEYAERRRGWIYQDFVELNGDLSLAPDMHPTPLPEFVRLEGLTYLRQEFNNCAPTALTIALTYYGGTADTDPARDYLRPTYNQDVSVDIAQMVDYVNTGAVPGVRAIWRMGGNWTTIRQLVASDFPVVIETSVEVGEPQPGWAGHNRVIIGYDGDDTLLTYDSYLGSGGGEGYRVSEAELDEVWRHMNRNYMVIYPIERESEVAYILGEDWNIAGNIDRSHRIALAEMAANPDDVFALFNLGTTYTAQGLYEEAAAAFDLAFNASRTGPEQIPFRIFWYQFSIFEAYYNMGRYNEVVDHARRTLNNMGGNAAEELYYWLGMGYAARGQLDKAKTQFENALNFNPHYEPAQIALEQIVTGTFRPPM